MNREILNEIENNINQLTKSQRKVADYILKKPMQSAFSTIDQLAQLTGTSTATVVRLATHFGYNGYADFQKDLQANLQKAMAPSNRLEESLKKMAPSDTIVSDIINAQLQNLTTTFNNLNDETLYEVSRILSGAHHTYVIGSRSCHGVSHYLAFNLNRILGNVDFLDASDCMLGEILYRVQPSDVVIAISLPRYLNSVVTAAKIAREAGAYVIAVTDSYLSPLAAHCSHLLTAECKSYDFHNSTLSISLIAEILISLVTKENPISVKTFLAESEKLLKQFSIHVNKE